MKRILIETDLEGVSGVGTLEMIEGMRGEGYRRACERLTADTNAAIAGAFDGGADEVLVEDGHGGGHNFLPGALDPRAKLVTLDAAWVPEDVAALMQVGAHAMAGTLGGFLDHTQSSKCWYRYSVNGRPCGELAMTAYFTGAYGAPCVMASGDEAACMEARQFFGSPATAAVKTAVRRNLADCLPDGEAERLIYAAAVEGMKRIASVKPLTPLLPMELKLETTRQDYCDDVCLRRSDVERVDARTVRRVVTQIRHFTDLLF